MKPRDRYETRLNLWTKQKGIFPRKQKKEENVVLWERKEEFH